MTDFPNKEAQQKLLIELAHAKMPFGKYEGSYLVNLPERYLIWYRQKGFPKGKLGKQMEQMLDIKINGLEPMIRNIQRHFQKQ
ncbi:DUF3820 family protein [Kordia algicida OT-1]|uniref:Cytoplasmic protein n=1 Tax=Kordia algicida OT-1 TaxID=391587 RepID=A9E2R9_9FLAO|nr:DUF3820 family protein [Kordia algicida]EDP95423.1 hypothetical protein KAOT1_10886 [Kordia algicida OT-1]